MASPRLRWNSVLAGGRTCNGVVQNPNLKLNVPSPKSTAIAKFDVGIPKPHRPHILQHTAYIPSSHFKIMKTLFFWTI